MCTAIFLRAKRCLLERPYVHVARHTWGLGMRYLGATLACLCMQSRQDVIAAIYIYGKKGCKTLPYCSNVNDSHIGMQHRLVLLRKLEDGCGFKVVFQPRQLSVAVQRSAIVSSCKSNRLVGLDLFGRHTVRIFGNPDFGWVRR